MAPYSYCCSPLASTSSPSQVRRCPLLAPCYIAAPTFAEACVNLLELPERVSTAAYTRSPANANTAMCVNVAAAMAAHEASFQALSPGSLSLSLRARQAHDPRSPEEEKERDTTWSVHAGGLYMKMLDTLCAHSSPVVCPVCCDASKYSCLSCGTAKAAEREGCACSLSPESVRSSSRKRQPVMLLKAHNFKFTSKVHTLMFPNRAKAPKTKTAQHAGAQKRAPVPV